MTTVSRSEGVIRVGEMPSLPERTALVEARGALLAWDVLGDAPVPAAEIHDAEQAAEWLWEVYGPDGAAAVLGDATEVELAPVDGPVAVLAWLRWAQAWWPASVIAGIPSLDPALLAAEIAVHTAAVEHLLDDEDAVTRALADVTTPFGDEVETVLVLREQVEAIADDFGVTLLPAEQGRRADWALAAGEPMRDGLRLRSGATAVDWSLVPAGVLDAAAPAWWELRRTAGATVLSVSVEAAPSARPVELLARCAPDFEVPLHPDGNAFVGVTAVDVTWLTEDIAPVVYAPRFAAADRIGAPVDMASQSAVLGLARARLTSPDASLTEREAGRRR